MERLERYGEGVGGVECWRGLKKYGGMGGSKTRVIKGRDELNILYTCSNCSNYHEAIQLRVW